MELHLGIMTTSELAQWFGISEKSFQNSKKKKLQILEGYAEFTSKRGSVNITKIINPFYNKKSARKYVFDNVENVWGELNTGKNVGHQLYEKMEDTEVLEKTIVVYSNEWRRENYGVAKKRRGKKGDCQIVWAEYIQETRTYRELSEKELKIIHKISADVFGEYNDESLKIRMAYDEGELSKEEYDEAMDDLRVANADNFTDFYEKTEKELGFPLVRATKLTKLMF